MHICRTACISAGGAVTSHTLPSILPCPHGRTSNHLSGASDGGVLNAPASHRAGGLFPISSRPTAFFPLFLFPSLLPLPPLSLPSLPPFFPSFFPSPVTVIYYSPLLIHMAYKTAPRLGWCVGCNSYFVINGDMTCPRCNTPTVTARCTRCGHTWVPSRLAPGVPKYCTKCHSPYYDRTPVRNNSKVRRGSA